MARLEGRQVTADEVAAAYVGSGWTPRPGSWGLEVLTTNEHHSALTYYGIGARLVVWSGHENSRSAIYSFWPGVHESAKAIAALSPVAWSSACVASPTGVSSLVWSREHAAEELEAVCEERGWSLAEIERSFTRATLGSPAEWADWLNLHGAELFGGPGQGTGVLSTIGYRPSDGLLWHLYALREALRQFGEWP